MRPLSGAVVRVRGLAKGAKLHSGVTAADGHFVVRDAGSGLRRVTLQLPGQRETAPIQVNLSTVPVVLVLSLENRLSEQPADSVRSPLPSAAIAEANDNGCVERRRSWPVKT